MIEDDVKKKKVRNVKHEIIHIETERNDVYTHIDNKQKIIDESVLQVPHIEER